MAWTTPMTAVNNAVWTSAQFNTHVRDNLNEQAVTLASGTDPGQFFFSKDSTGELMMAKAAVHKIANNQTTTSSSYTDLATVGPTVTVSSTVAKAWTIVWGCRGLNTGTDNPWLCSIDISGATTLAAHDDRAIQSDGLSGSEPHRQFSVFRTNFNAGSTTVTMKYRVPAATGSFMNRFLAVIPL